MKRTSLCFLIILFSCTTCIAQHENEIFLKTDSVHQLVVRLFNQEDMNGIYDMSDSSFRNFISRNKFTQFLYDAKNRFGNIENSVYSGRSHGFFIYDTQFRNGTMDLLLAIDQSSNISGFAIHPIFRKQPAQTNNPLSNRIDSLVDKAIRPYIQQSNTFGVSIGILYNGRVYKYGYGKTTKENHRLPDANTIYEIGSITKTFTATLLALRVLQGKCSLNDPVNKYLPKNIPLLQREGHSVTLEMLANHTSGLPRIPADLFIQNSSPDDPYRLYDTIRLYHYLDSVRLRTVPGLQLNYSNLGFGLLGTILARVSGFSYQSLLELYICGPLQMNDTRIVLNEEQKERLAKGYLENGKQAPYWHFSALAGCGAIRSTVNDLMKYLRVHMQPDTTKVLGKAIRLTEEPTYTADNIQIGLGWFSLNDSPGTYWHNGGTGGFRSFCAYSPSKQVAVIILANSALSVDKAGAMLIRKLVK